MHYMKFYLVNIILIQNFPEVWLLLHFFFIYYIFLFYIKSQLLLLTENLIYWRFLCEFVQSGNLGINIYRLFNFTQTHVKE